MQASLTESPINILLIDDDDVDREKITRLLKLVPITTLIRQGSSAKEALALIEKHSFQCAILDYQLQDALGSELVDVIKNHNKTPVPIIMVSGSNDERVVATVMRDGVFDYLPKKNLAAADLQNSLEKGLKWARFETDMLEQRARFYQLAEGLPQLVWTCLPDGRCDFVNHRWLEFTGISADEELDAQWLSVIHEEDKAHFVKFWHECVEQGNDLRVNIRLRSADGEFRWFDTRATTQRNTDNEIIRWLGSNTDITDFELTRQALITSEQRFHAAFDFAPLGMALVGLDGNMLQINSSMHMLLGDEVSDPQEPASKATRNIADISHPDDIENEKYYLLELTGRKLNSVQFEKRLIDHDEHIIHTQVSVALINQHTNPPCYLYQFYDLSERKRYEEKLIHLAHFDSLTGLGNRAKLFEEVNFLISKSQRNPSPFALLFGDLDNFKQINDGLGHEAGDLLLKIVARRLQKAVRRGDSVSRLGGDEFVILLQDISKYEAVVTIAEKLITCIKRPSRIGSHIAHVGISFGIAFYPSDGDDAQTLLRNADSALYDAKDKGRGCYQLYRKELTEYVHNRLMLDADIHRALDNGEFRLHYQPIIHLQSKKIVSLEALIRWQHPLQGMIPPDEFIPFAEESGLINSIGEWVIFEVCRQTALWHKQGYDITVAINISARQFQQNSLAGIIQQALEKHSLEAKFLTLEITEQMFLENTRENIIETNQLKEMGVKIALDDFGTGYSSLSYIINFAPHYLKIDRYFVNKIGTANEQDALVKTIVELNKIIPMHIIAEGVETQEQEEFLRYLGCELAQGYRFSRPLEPLKLPVLFDTMGIADN